ncbi:MAG: gfo/Idh/MocA family oxidoreductase, partial [Gemmataceae bacterium]
FATHRAKHGAGQRYGLNLYGSRGIINIGMGSMPPVWWCDDPSWNPGQSRAKWEAVTSAGPGKPEPLQDASLDAGNVWIVKDLLEAIAKDRQPLSSVYDGRAALEMILAVYESHRQGQPVALPLTNREHPLRKGG